MFSKEKKFEYVKQSAIEKLAPTLKPFGYEFESELFKGDIQTIFFLNASKKLRFTVSFFCYEGYTHLGKLNFDFFGNGLVRPNEGTSLWLERPLENPYSEQYMSFSQIGEEQGWKLEKASSNEAPKLSFPEFVDSYFRELEAAMPTLLKPYLDGDQWIPMKDNRGV